MNAATDSATAARGGCGLSHGGPEAVEAGPPEGRSARPVPAAPPATATTPAQSGRALVPAARQESSPVPVPGAWLASFGATRSHVSQQLIAAALDSGRDSSDQSEPVSAAAGGAGTKPAGRAPVPGPAGGGRETLPDHGEPVSAHVVEGGPECAAVAHVEALDGSERALLLRHIAQAWPEVVEAGAELVAQWRAEAAGHRQERARRMKRERRRRLRADTGRQA